MTVAVSQDGSQAQRYDGIAVALHRQVMLTAQGNLLDAVHRKMQTRHHLRRARRYRKTPPRPNRFDNRHHGGGTGSPPPKRPGFRPA